MVVLIPDSTGPVQIIDVRDLAGWLVDSAIGDVRGTFNVTGETIALPEVLRRRATVAGHTGPVGGRAVGLAGRAGVETWTGPRSLPLWLADDPEWTGFGSRDSSRARAAGLRHRPLRDTLADTLAWELTRDPTRCAQAGLTDDDERDLLRGYAR